MSLGDINNNQYMLEKWLDNTRRGEEQYHKDNPDSLIYLFEKELKELGFEFDTSAQVVGFVPKYKEIIIPIAIRYYQLARDRKKPNEQNYFLSFFCIKGFDVVIPMLLKDYYFEQTADLTRWFISDCIYQIQSGKFIKEYLDIVSDKRYGPNRQMIVLLLGKLKEDNTISTLIDLLEDEEVCLQAINALGNFKCEEFRQYFERFLNSTNSGCRKYAKDAIKKLDNKK